MLVKANTAYYIARQEVKVCPRYHVNDMRHELAERDYFIALAKERMCMHNADRSKRALKMLPHRLRTYRLPLDDEDCGADDCDDAALRRPARNLTFIPAEDIRHLPEFALSRTCVTSKRVSMDPCGGRPARQKPPYRLPRRGHWPQSVDGPRRRRGAPPRGYSMDRVPTTHFQS